MRCPHCQTRMTVRDSLEITSLARELRYRCENDDCGATFVAQLELIRTVRPSGVPNPAVQLPLANQNLRHGADRPANDDHVVPANDDRADDTGEAAVPMIETG